MNREIKFRVWILSAKENWTGTDNFEAFDWNNRMRFVDSIHFPLNKFSGKDIVCEPICENDNYSNGWIGNSFNSVNTESKKEYVLMQFTGLYDKNGKEIYECDEMSGEDAYGEKIKGVVKFINGAFLLISNNHFFTQVGHSNHSHTYFRDMAGQLEICGLVIANLLVTEE